MRKFERLAEPDFLTGRWEQWGLEWERRLNENRGAEFHWHKIGGEKVNDKLLPLLKAQTQEHCSFCDFVPIAPPSIETIEHFRPKSTFPREAYHWNNLYFCCMHCQQKGAEYSEALLRPDSDDYEFDRYFRWNFISGEIEVNTLASAGDQERARVTIKTYRLNDDHPRLRKLWLQEDGKDRAFALELRPYRDYAQEEV
jgi:uncharacterized protein (TIGR02646 family)